jgi:hypothetical protein
MPLEQLPNEPKRELPLQLAADSSQYLNTGCVSSLMRGSEKRRLPDSRRSLDHEHHTLPAQRRLQQFADRGDFGMALKHCRSPDQAA